MAEELQPDGMQTLALYTGHQISIEEIEKRQQEAEELDKKLRHILEDVPTKVMDVRGSMAGASSSDFHRYRHARRREQERLKQIDEEADQAEAERALQEKAEKLKEIEDAKTAKRRAKRQKKKEKQQNKKQKQHHGDDAAPATTGDDDTNNNNNNDDDDDDDGDIQQPDLD